METTEMVMSDTVANATCSMTDIDAKAVEPAETAAKKRADFSFVNNIFGTLSESEADARQLRCACGVQQCVCF